MKIELTEKEYNKIDDILHELARHSMLVVLIMDMVSIVTNHNRSLTRYTNFGSR